MSQERYEKIRSIVASVYKVPVETVSLDEPLSALGKDSLDAFSLVFALEDEFKVALPDECLDPTRSLRELADRVEALQGGSPPPAPSGKT
ncbi:MAG TPA: acyl carrier protein [Vicinamibacteria bacterium]